MAEAKQQYEKIIALWTLSTSSDDGVIPQNHQLRFVEALRELPVDVMNKVMAKEIRELQTGRAQIQLAQKTIRAREACIARITKCSDAMQRGPASVADLDPTAQAQRAETAAPSQHQLAEVAALIQQLRQLSIQCVE